MWSCRMSWTICIAGGQSAASLKWWQDINLSKRFIHEKYIFLSLCTVHNSDKGAGKSIT